MDTGVSATTYRDHSQCSLSKTDKHWMNCTKIILIYVHLRYFMSIWPKLAIMSAPETHFKKTVKHLGGNFVG